MLGKFFLISKMARHQNCNHHHQYAKEQYPFVTKGQYIINKVIHFIKSHLPIIPKVINAKVYPIICGVLVINIGGSIVDELTLNADIMGAELVDFLMSTTATVVGTVIIIAMLLIAAIFFIFNMRHVIFE